MAALWPCSFCGYRFEDEESVLDHEEVCDDIDESRSCPGCGVLLEDQDAEDSHDCPLDEDDEDEDDDDL